MFNCIQTGSLFSAYTMWIIVVGPLKIPLASKSKETGIAACKFQAGCAMYHASSDASLFSSSLPVLPHEKCMVIYSSKKRIYLCSLFTCSYLSCTVVQ